MMTFYKCKGGRKTGFRLSVAKWMGIFPGYAKMDCIFLIRELQPVLIARRSADHYRPAGLTSLGCLFLQVVLWRNIFNFLLNT
jgi:hypothetical protein